jgi:hypothetical protein
MTTHPHCYRWIAAACAIPLGVLGSEVLAWWWTHPARHGPVDILTYQLPPGPPQVVRKNISAGVLKALKCDTGIVGTIDTNDGRQVEVSFFEWNEAERKAIFQAFHHAPDVCMSTSGITIEAHLAPRRFELDGRTLMFDTTRFRPNGRDALHIFKAPWSDDLDRLNEAAGPGQGNLLRDGPAGKSFRTLKLRSLAKRYSPSYARVLMGAVSGFEDDQQAWDYFVATVLKDLRFERIIPD